MMYKVVESDDRRGIVYAVSIACDDGWLPCGGISVSVCTASHNRKYHQAMIKRSKERDSLRI